MSEKEEKKTGMAGFYIFLGLLIAAGLLFGLYVSGLESCSKQASATFTVMDCHKLYLAFGVLFTLTIMLALGAAFYALLPRTSDNGEHPGKQIFDSFVKILPPLATLVLGYYFGSTATGAQQSKDTKTPSTVEQKKETKPMENPTPPAPAAKSELPPPKK